MKNRALLVDDEPTILQTFTALFEMFGFDVRAASSAASATKMIVAGQFDLVVTDMSMETPDAGYAVVRAANEQGYKPKIVIVTAYPQLAEGWERKGVHAVFHKPTDIACPARGELAQWGSEFLGRAAQLVKQVLGDVKCRSDYSGSFIVHRV